MKRIVALLVLSGTVLCAIASGPARADSPIPQEDLERFGLERAWFTQITAHGALAEVEHVRLSDDLLLVQTRNGVLDAIETNSGRIRWSRRLGNPDYPSHAPSGNRNFVATLNGRTAYVLNRFTGDVVWSREFDGAPGAGPVLGVTQLFIPRADGSVLAYPASAKRAEDDDPLAGLIASVEKKTELTEAEKAEIERNRRQRLAIDRGLGDYLVCQSFGRIFVQPVCTTQDPVEETLAWQTDRGSVFLGRVQLGELASFLVKTQIAVRAEVASRMTWIPGVDRQNGQQEGRVVFGAVDGVVWVVSSRTGEEIWHFPTNQPISAQVAAVGDAVFAPTDSGGMYCLDLADGRQRWWAPGLVQFISASKDRVYAVDRNRRIVTLDVRTGERISAFEATHLRKLVNMQTDRIFLVTSGGMVQCVHEIGLDEPLRHVPERTPEAEKKAATPEPEAKPAEEPAQEAAPAEPEANPFNGEPEKEEDNPFSSSSDYDPFAEM